jgi:hypothetical protein
MALQTVATFSSPIFETDLSVVTTLTIFHKMLRTFSTEPPFFQQLGTHPSNRKVRTVLSSREL